MAKGVLDPGRWARLIRRVARATGRDQDAEDLLHSAWLRVQAARTSRPIENSDAYLVSAAVNISRNQARSERRSRVDDRYDFAAIAVPDTAPLQDEVFAARKRLEKVREGLDQLSPRTREVFLLARVDGLKGREIAERLGISQSAVEKHMAKATLFFVHWMEEP